MMLFLASRKEWHAPDISSLSILSYTPRPSSPSAFLHPYLHRLDKAILRSINSPSLFTIEGQWLDARFVVSHVGFGNGMFLKDFQMPAVLVF